MGRENTKEFLDFRITASELIEGFEKALRLLEREEEFLNKINVYPIADADTGTNMLHTLRGAMEQLGEPKRVDEVVKTLAEASLETARGNSGVILSQFLQGMSESLEGKKFAKPHEVAHSLFKGSKKAYLAVIKPEEGTILTVMEKVAKKAVEDSYKNFQAFFHSILDRAIEALEKTREAMKIKRQSEVVDSGAYGFFLLLKGLSSVFVDRKGLRIRGQAVPVTNLPKESYCTNVLIKKESDIDKAALKNKLSKLGKSVVVSCTGDSIKVHIHTDKPKEVNKVLSRIGKISGKRIERL